MWHFWAHFMILTPDWRWQKPYIVNISANYWRWLRLLLWSSYNTRWFLCPHINRHLILYVCPSIHSSKCTFLCRLWISVQTDLRVNVYELTETERWHCHLNNIDRDHRLSTDCLFMLLFQLSLLLIIIILYYKWSKTDHYEKAWTGFW
jgi:NADH:ubiquinone oxidoreductase subunit 4 (subunit M)